MIYEQNIKGPKKLPALIREDEKITWDTKDVGVKRAGWHLCFSPQYNGLDLKEESKHYFLNFFRKFLRVFNIKGFCKIV